MSISRIFLLAATALTVVILVSITVLRMNSVLALKSITQMENALRSGQAMAQLERAFLAYNRISNLHAVQDDELTRSLQGEALDDLEVAMEEAMRQADDSLQRRVVERLKSDISSYVDRRKALEGSGLGLEKVIAEVSPNITTVLESTHALRQDEKRKIEETTQIALAARNDAQILTIVAIILVIAALSVSFFVVRRRIVVPISYLQTQVSHARAGGQPILPGPRMTPELEDLATTLNEMRSRINAERERQLTFVSSVAHDLKNPLTSVKGYLQLLLKQLDTSEKERLKQLAEVAFTEAGRIEHMLYDLIEASRVEAGYFSLNLDMVNLSRLCVESIESIRGLATNHTFATSLPQESVHVRGDIGRLRQVMDNLLSNAVKYSPMGGTVTVTLEESDDLVVVKVSDEGIGVANEDMAAVFEPFRRTDATRYSFKGIGLGLSVVKKLVEAHGGEISLESRLGKGTTFRVALPKQTSLAI